MYKKLLTGLLGLAACCMTATAQEITPSTSPNATQQAMQKRGYGMFIHFGVNTYGQTEWSDGSIPVERYNPTRLDPDQWVRVARDAGFRYVLLVTKHHDGFCLWDSKYTTYDVASSPVKTDVVGAVAEACRKYGLEFAVYYSLWDRKDPSYRDPDKNKYIDYMCNQLTELLTQYGDVCELWFDGGWDRAVADWDLPRVYKLVKQLQPHCAVGVNHTIEQTPGSRQFALPDSMTVDNRYGFQYFPSDFRLWDPKIAHKRDHKQYLHNGESYYVPFEHTVCLSKAWSWFQKEGPQPVRDLDELEELFYWCTDNGNTLVMNVPPDQTGRIRENEAEAIISLGQRLGLKRGKPLPTNGAFRSLERPTTASSVYEDDSRQYGAHLAVDGGMQTRWAAADTLSTLTIDLDPQEPFDKISIFEYCDTRNGDDGFSNYRTNRIQAYHIDLLQNGQWETIYADTAPMGDCKVIRLSRKYQAEKIRLCVTKATAPASIYEFCVIDHEQKGRKK
ncbi:alpha-L-fucosidase [Millionella massiliensis]|uniref:alpha-L-fucosidase n=1 Tax=Millionella massiliensis TaxID=1871023 RepID=UPI0023A8AC29|nr:alpha-L-fucosidase [Millionella massiliensis]